LFELVVEVVVVNQSTQQALAQTAVEMETIQIPQRRDQEQLIREVVVEVLDSSLGNQTQVKVATEDQESWSLNIQTRAPFQSEPD
jgi:hypothetical protein